MGVGVSYVRGTPVQAGAARVRRIGRRTRIPSVVASPVTANHAAKGSVLVNLRNTGNLGAARVRRSGGGADGHAPGGESRAQRPAHRAGTQREFFIDNLLVRVHFTIVMIRWIGLAPWEFEFPFPGSLTSTFLVQVPTPQNQNLKP